MDRLASYRSAVSRYIQRKAGNGFFLSTRLATLRASCPGPPLQLTASKSEGKYNLITNILDRKEMNTKGVSYICLVCELKLTIYNH